MNTEIIMSIVTIVVTFILGLISKKLSWVSNNLIPLQNLLIGIIMAIIYYFMTKDISINILLSGILTGGTYDILKNLKELTNNTSNNKEEVDEDGSVG